MKSMLLLVSAIVIVLLLPSSIVAIGDFRMKDQVEPHILATANVTTGTVTLTKALYNGDVANVAATSNNTDDAPLPLSYVTATKILSFDGLLANSSRTLTITYKIERLGDYVAADMASKIWPIFLMLGVFGLIAGAVVVAVRHGE